MIHDKCKSTTSVRVPFSGFHKTIHEEMIKLAMEEINFNEDDHDKDNRIDPDNICWADVKMAYAHSWLAGMVKETRLDLTFEKIINSRDYGIDNDALVAKIPLATLESLHADMTEAESAEWKILVAGELEDRPGFAAWDKYSSDVDDWGSVDKWDDAQRDLFFHFRIAPRINETFLAERAAGRLEEMIWTAVIDPDKAPGHVDCNSDAGPDI